MKNKKCCQLNPDRLLTLRCSLISEILEQETKCVRIEEMPSVCRATVLPLALTEVLIPVPLLPSCVAWSKELHFAKSLSSC